MLKSSCFLGLSLLLITGVVSAIPGPKPLLKIVASSPTIAGDHYTNTCTINDTGVVVIAHSVTVSPSGLEMISQEQKTVSLNTKVISAVIAKAALGTVTGLNPIGGTTYKYVAYQQQKTDAIKEIFLFSVLGGQINNSSVVKPLINFMTSVCGNMSIATLGSGAQ